MFADDSPDPGTGIVPRKRFQPPVLPMPAIDPNEQPGAQPDGPPNPFEKALAMGTALGNTPPPDTGATPTPTLGASPEASATVAQAQPGITRKPFFSAAERGIKNPVLRTLAQIGDVAGSVLMPGITDNIPGTRANENIAQNRELARQKEQAETGFKDAQTDALRHPKPQKAENPEADAYAVLSDPNSTPEQRQSATEALNTVKDAGKKGGTPEEQVFADYIKQGKTPEEAFKLTKQAGQKPGETHTAEDIRSAIAAAYEQGNPAEVARLQKKLKAVGDPYAQQKIVIEQGRAEDSHAAAEQKKKDAVTKQVAPLQGTLDEAQHAHEMQKMADAGNAEADVDLALSFFKVMRSGGQGIRFTRQEQDLILGARNSAGDLNAMAQKVVGQGQKFTPEQRKQIVDVIDSHAKAAQSAMDRIQGGKEAGASSPARPANVPEGYVYKDGAKGKGWYKP